MRSKKRKIDNVASALRTLSDLGCFQTALGLHEVLKNGVSGRTLTKKVIVCWEED